MGDLFGIGVPEHWTERVLDKIGRSWYREHRFYLLTKQPQNLPQWSPFPDNCWVGVTACNFEMMDNAILYLDQIEAKIKYISIEPFLGEIPIPVYGFGVDWLIIGAQTKPYKPPKIEYVEEIVRAADKAGVPVFLKDNLKPLFSGMTKTEVDKYPQLVKKALLFAKQPNDIPCVVDAELR